MKRGKFFVIEGIDGSGKETQTTLLIEALQKKGIKVKKMDFPQYGQTFFGDLVGRFLKGEFGSIKEVNPYLASLTYAGDRWQAKDEINSYLNKGYFVISNRYAKSSMGHQGAKLKGKERKKLLEYLYKLEYEIYGIPEEDLDIFLDVPANFGKKLVLKKAKRNYLGNRKKRDIHEADAKHQEEARKVYLNLIKKFPYIKKVECTKNGKLLSIDDIHSKVWKIVESML
jgi:dTMP kinase